MAVGGLRDRLQPSRPAAGKGMMREPVYLRVRSHGAYQVEFKIDYELTSERDNRYTVNTYIFAPYNLGVSSRTYSNNDFHRDIQNYVRLSTPVLTLDALLQDSTSPLVKCEQIVETHKWHDSRRNRDRLVTNLKLMRPILNVSARAHLRAALDRYRRTAKSESTAAELERSLDEMLSHGDAFVDRLRRLEGRLAGQEYVDETCIAFCRAR